MAQSLVAIGIELIDVRFRYDQLSGRGVGPVSMSVSMGDHIGLIGPSGCGKSTLLKIIAGLLPNSGENRLEGTIDNRFSDEEVGFMFQHPALLPQKTVLENVCLPLLARSNASQDEKAALELLCAVGLSDAVHLLPEQLSGGMRTRVSMARALLLRPTLLLLDEPFSGLDIAARESAYGVIDKLVVTTHATTILVTHDLEEAWRMCDRIIVLDSSGRRHGEIEQLRAMDLGSFRESLVSLMAVSN